METDFDWIAAREECSPKKAFQRLMANVKADVERRREALPGFRIEFDTDSPDTSGFGVHRIENRYGSWVGARFLQTKDGLKITTGESHAEETAVAVRMNKDGECRFVIGDEELKEWQLRARVLGPILFLSGT